MTMTIVRRAGASCVVVAVVLAGAVRVFAAPLGTLYRNGQLVESFEAAVPTPQSVSSAADQRALNGAAHPGRGHMGAPELSQETQRRNAALASAADKGAALGGGVARLSEHDPPTSEALDELRSVWRDFSIAARRMRSELVQVGRDVDERGLPDEIRTRHRATLVTFRAGLIEIRKAVRGLLARRPGAGAQAVEVLNRLLFRYDPVPLSAALPFDRHVVEAPSLDVAKAPAVTARANETEIIARELALAAPAPADLTPTVDVQLTPEILAKATELGNSAVRIYEFVRNHVQFQPYLGSRKGSAETLKQLAGNDTDQASLLIALLRAAGIPSRYVRGALEITPAQATAWLRVDDAATAASMLTTAGLDGVAIVNGSTVVAVRFTHVWVEAYVPYGNYRGVPNSPQEPIWVTLDPSLKQSEITPGQDILTPLGFDADGYLADYISTFHLPSPIEKLVADVQAYLDLNAPGTTVKQIERTDAIAPRALGLLPTSLPAVQLSVSARFSVLEDAKRYKVRFRLYDGGTTFIDHTANLPEMVGKAVTIEYVGATPSDQATIDSYGTIYNTPPNLVNVKPRLKMDGAAVATSANAIGMGRTHSSDMQFIHPTGASNAQPLIQNTIIAGNGQAIAFDTFLDVRDVFFDGDDFRIDSNLESVLHSTAVDYLNRVDRGQEQAGRLMRIVTTQDVSEAIVENSIAVALSGGTPVSFEWTGLTVDADRRIIGPFHVTGDESKSRPYMILTGMDGSTMENRVFEDIYDQEAISTIKILELASEASIPICTIDTSIAADCPGINQPSAIINAINNALANGNVVTIPRSPITVAQWSGTGYIDMEPATGAAGYIISGGISAGVTTSAGGATVDFWPIILPCLFSTITGAEVLEPANNSPDSGAVFCADNTTITFKVKLTVQCDFLFMEDPPPMDILRDLQTHRTKADLGPGDYVLVVPVSGNPDVTRDVTILGVKQIDANLDASGMHSFLGHMPFPFISQKSPDPGEHLAILFKDVVDPSLTVQSFAVDLKAVVGTTKVTDSTLNEQWSFISPPPSGALNRQDTFEIKLENPSKGGVYRVKFALGSPCDALPQSEANIILPLAGAEVKDIVSSDLARADAFATLVLANYNVFERNSPFNGLRWFNDNGAGDYIGRPDSAAQPTVWAYNGVASSGLGSVGTWFGVPVRTAKMSNFVVAYGARKIGVVPLAAWIAQVIGSFNDSSGSKSWDAGWAVAGGSAYASTASAMVKDIFDESDEKNQRLWPNSASASNHVAQSAWSDPDHQFASPGFLEMSSP